MIKILIKNLNYLIIILFSIALFSYHSEPEYYFVVKYLTTFRVIDIMASIFFTFLSFKMYFDNYYYLVIDRYNIIVRLGRKKYYHLILKQLLIPSVIFVVLNLLLDFLITGHINIIYVLFNVLFALICVIFLPKKKEYNNEFLLVLIISIFLKLVYFKLFIF